jgi:pyruvate dehydrogenase E2 component (dihydrolipoamide acetyltransferase)
MAIAFRLPDLGEGIVEAEIVEWLVTEGDTVGEHQLLVRVETDKAMVEVPAPAAGRVGRIRHHVGDTVHVGEVLVWILAPGESAAEVAGQQEAQHEVAGSEHRSVTVVGALNDKIVELPAQTPQHGARAAPTGHVLATPAVRRLAREQGVRIEDIVGTGIAGRVTEADVREYAAQQDLVSEPQGAEDGYGAVQRVALRGVRRAIARRLKTAVSRAALATHMDEIDVTALVAYAGAAHDAPALLAWIVKGVAQALQRHPQLNATLDDVHEEMVLWQYVSIGIAVDTTDGLMVPVIRDVAHKSVADIAAEAEQLSAACRQRTIDIGAMRGGTFSVSNIGSLGGIFATPIPNYPEVAILATGRITERLSRAADGSIVSRHILPVSLSFDHRVVDGADAARFVNTLRQILAEPERLG